MLRSLVGSEMCIRDRIQDNYSRLMQESYAHQDSALKLIMMESFHYLYKAGGHLNIARTDTQQERQDVISKVEDAPETNKRCSASAFLAMCLQLQAKPFWNPCMKHRHCNLRQQFKCLSHRYEDKFDLEKYKLWFGILDVSSDGTIEECEFLGFADLAQCPLHRNIHPKWKPQPRFPKLKIFATSGTWLRIWPVRSSLQTKSQLSRLSHWTMFAEFSNPKILDRETDKKYHVNVRFSTVMDAVLVIQLVSTIATTGNTEPERWTVDIDFVTGLIFSAEALLYFFAEMNHEVKAWYLVAPWQRQLRGGLSYFFSFSCLVDLLAVIFTWLNVSQLCGDLTGAANCNSESTHGSTFSSVVGLARILRVMRFVNRFQSFDIILKATASMAKNLIPWLFNLYALFYFFAVIGMAFLSYTVTRIDWSVAPYSTTAFGEEEFYVDNNFDDFGRSLVTLFELMVVNNWHVIVEGHVVACNDNKAIRLYFFIFNIASSIIFVNILVSIMIGLYTLVHDVTIQDLHRDAAQEQLSLQQMGQAPAPQDHAELETVAAVWKPFQSRLDILNLLALSEAATLESFCSSDTKARRLSKTRPTSRTGSHQHHACDGNWHWPELVLAGKEGVPDRPLWYIKNKVKRSLYFTEGGQTELERTAEVEKSIPLLLRESLERVPAAVALRYENGQYLYCNSCWALHLGQTPPELIGKFDSTDVNQDWRRHRIRAMRRGPGTKDPHKHIEAWDLAGEGEFFYELSEIQLSDGSNGWRVVLSVASRLGPAVSYTHLTLPTKRIV
eukprot:TRINITY_DN12366_c0_g1_i5.p1 TRINITY_DN12366_c0_g1~~TRINITY_DN12366_c0_g1_i5.p1  ORF type:complete len:782 (+),score=171.93 TRINITY_DN12366_c0_g1_i5:96-2441(+)